MKDKYAEFRINKVLDKSKLPSPIFEAEPGYIELYWKAWELAWAHVIYQENMPQPEYIDEAFDPYTNWIWDTCFMALFCRYGYQIFPGIESLDNFYYIMHEHAPHFVKIEHSDNPPLFAWVEWEYLKFTHDLKRLKLLIQDKQFLQRHYNWIEQSKSRKLYKFAKIWTFAERESDGFRWSGVASGMDNTPRGYTHYKKILWLDLSAQQGLVAKNIAQMANLLGLSQEEEEYTAKYNQYKDLLNKWYWNDVNGCYFDITRKLPHKQVEVITPASFWPMLAEMCNPEQAEKMAQLIRDPNILGGIVPFPSVARNDPAFCPKGRYWKGSIWVPTAYMTLKALEKYHYYDIADNAGEQLVQHMLKTYKQYDPHTIWEAYNPMEPIPATTNSNVVRVRSDFCGWSALGPISVFIENILGFHEINALTKQINWKIHHECKHGIQNLRFGSIITDLIYDNHTLNVTSNEPYTLTVNDKIFSVKAGKQTITLG